MLTLMSLACFIRRVVLPRFFPEISELLSGREEKLSGADQKRSF
jgi:hypothetical protein